MFKSSKRSKPSVHCLETIMERILAIFSIVSEQVFEVDYTLIRTCQNSC